MARRQRGSGGLSIIPRRLRASLSLRANSLSRSGPPGEAADAAGTNRRDRQKQQRPEAEEQPLLFPISRPAENTAPGLVPHGTRSELALEKVFADWPIGIDPAIHIAALQKLFDSGATIVNVHSGQPDQNRVIDFYRRSALPEFAQAASSVAH
jgi:hypothetical protein